MPAASTPVAPKHTASNASVPTPKIIFFDIDDTLSRGGIIAEHNKATLQALAKTDIKLVISTGRSKAILPEDIIALLDSEVLDAIICMNGQYSYDHQGIISDYPLTEAHIEDMQRLCQSSNVTYKFDSATHLAWVNDNELIREYNNKNIYSIIDPEHHHNNAVYQCSVFFNHSDEQMQDIDFAAYGLKLVHWHYIGADILPIEASKARGILDVCAYYGVDAKDCMAFGDGMNDLEMFDLVGFAVAMGDAKEALKARADLVTGTIEEHGIQAVIEQLAVHVPA
ncbi:Cof-type HAD-IIB family hydrolase [Psychrobacter aestuarii]|uniref:Cof-type HAD-IIB family hydrolase n=1 Tax=Psychrobacter aestuarii TaxID=556327 RepID=A0ABN0VT57_9GAMM|nr:Cof-type HAD-IIB family hydrolase [Psychrobacter aestuarii]